MFNIAANLKPQHSTQYWLSKHYVCDECKSRVEKYQVMVYNGKKVCFDCKEDSING